MAEDLGKRLMADLLATSPAEAAAVLLGLAYVVLAARRSRWCWVAGAISSFILAWLAWRARLPMQAALNVWYVLMSGYGWYHWSRESGTLIRVWPLWKHVLGIGVSLLVAKLVASALSVETQAAWPYLDSATTLLSLLATWMVARMVLENWIYWILIDAVLVFLFAAQGLVFVALQFIVYLVIALAGFISWLRLYRHQPRS
jgi:nicotinamide mononucleotide transporter